MKKRGKLKNNNKFANALRDRKVIFVLLFAVIGSAFLIKGLAATPSAIQNFEDYYPNESTSSGYYLNGTNYAHNGQSWAVLWFGDVQNNGSYKMYNSNPADSNGDCHWDQFRWTKKELSYSQTRNLCNADTDIHYSPAITYLPRKWDGSDWQKTGSANATYYENGELKCSGINDWVTTIWGAPVELAPGVMATQMQSTQTTTWNSGPGSTVTGCKPGETSRYQENLYFVSDLPIYGDQKVAPGLKRSVGGSLDFYN